MNESDFEKIDSMIAHHVDTFADSIQHKLDIVVEGHQMLSEKMDRVETRLDKRMDCLEHKLVSAAAETSVNTTAIRDLSAETKSNTVAIRDLSAKLDGVAADLSAHRRDTEVRGWTTQKGAAILISSFCRTSCPTATEAPSAGACGN